MPSGACASVDVAAGSTTTVAITKEILLQICKYNLGVRSEVLVTNARKQVVFVGFCIGFLRKGTI